MVTGEHYFLQPSANLPRRDVFSPIAAYLSKGVDPANSESLSRTSSLLGAPSEVVNERRLRACSESRPLTATSSQHHAPGRSHAALLKTIGFKIVIGKREITGSSRAYALGVPGRCLASWRSMGYLEMQPIAEQRPDSRRR